MKAARTDRWYKLTYSHPPSPIQEFIAAHNFLHEEALSVLSAHTHVGCARPADDTTAGRPAGTVGSEPCT